ncbi:MAG: ABC transporter ATP-binding protein, partial [Solobacterium sp.]|nr:ABC transporter ATP-binding protein [Solobacterium sp.]
ADRLLILDDEGAEFFEGNYQEYSDLKKAQETVLKAEQPAKAGVKNEKKTLSPEGRRRQLAATEKKITEKENRLEECRALRFEPEYYEDFEKMNALEEEITGLEEEIADLMDEWEALSEG